MKRIYRLLSCGLLFALVSRAGASDHADPMSLNPFVLQDAPLANITDLHAFIVGPDGMRRDGPAKADDHLIVSLCVRRRLLHFQVADPALAAGLHKLTFRVHLDFDPKVTHYKNRKVAPPAGASPAERSRLIQNEHLARRMDDLYGGTIEEPNMIAEDATLEFRLRADRDGDNISVAVEESSFVGIPGRVTPLPSDTFNAETLELVKAGTPERPPVWNGGMGYVQAGFFDDPFIFPRFFRSNVIGVVASIPISRLIRRDGTRVVDGPVAGNPADANPILLWATTHLENGRQSDHVGRSLRTQLPRFEHLNQLHPSQHVAAILRRHGQPTLIENVLTTFIAPLEAHRFYDAVPDVMIYDLSKPAAFPNGRRFEDDVAQKLNDAGETLLYELSYLESRQYPRANKNDKDFRPTFPFLALPWTEAQTREHAVVGALADGIPIVPFAPDPGATALPDFTIDVWRSIWRGLAIGLVLFGALAAFAARSNWIRAAIVAVVCLAMCAIWLIRAEPLNSRDPGFMRQPIQKLGRTAAGSGVILLLGLTAVFAAGVRRGARPRAAIADTTLLAHEGFGQEDSNYYGSTFNEVRDAVLDEPYYGKVFGRPDAPPLPRSYIPPWKLVYGLFTSFSAYPFKAAAIRTIRSRADLRWGENRRGFERLLHPNGVCLAGKWRITQPTEYTGYFAGGKECLIIARYSSDETHKNRPRTLSIVGKLFPTLNPNERVPTASFITQTSLGGMRNESIFDALPLNAPDIRPLQSSVGFVKLLLSLLAFRPADIRPDERQLYEIAEAGEDKNRKGWKLRCPRYMRLTPVPPPGGAGGRADDFREEVLLQIYNRADPTPQRPLVFKIEVSEVGKVKGIINRTLQGAIWHDIGVIEFTEAAASYNGDHVIHFAHPRWRQELIDSNT